MITYFLRADFVDNICKEGDMWRIDLRGVEVPLKSQDIENMVSQYQIESEMLREAAFGQIANSIMKATRLSALDAAFVK